VASIDGSVGNRQQANGSQNTPASYVSAVTAGSAAGRAVKHNAHPAIVVNWSHTLVFAATNVPQQFPPFRVPPACSVRVRANNGQIAGNTKVVFVSEYRDVLQVGNGVPLNPLDDIALPVDNTGKVWSMGQAGDGVTVQVFTLQTAQ
jgi:hypothetical protein